MWFTTEGLSSFSNPCFYLWSDRPALSGHLGRSRILICMIWNPAAITTGMLVLHLERPFSNPVADCWSLALLGIFVEQHSRPLPLHTVCNRCDWFPGMMFVEQTSYLICFGEEITWPAGKWMMFALCEMWKKPPGGLFSESVWCQSRHGPSHLNAHLQYWSFPLIQC